MTMRDLKPGQSARIIAVGGEGALRQHFLDMGVIPGAEATLVKLAPMGDPMELQIHGYELTLRLEDAAKIEVEAVREAVPQEEVRRTRQGATLHPGLGQSGIYHGKTESSPLPDGTILTFALAGNQNCGKTTLFNALTGSNQHVGNFPGVTVDRKDGQIKGHPEATVTDLPGIYSLSPYTSEEVVSRRFILEDDPDAIIDIVDATNIERNLYLTLQLMELDRPMVLALNMMDELTANGGTVSVNRLEAALGIPVVPISAAREEGISELVEHVLHVARFREHPGRVDFCAADGPDHGALHRCIHGICHIIEDHAAAANLPVRFAATKLIEGDALVMGTLGLDQNELDAVEHIICQMEGESGRDRMAALADMRFSFIEGVCAECVVKPHESREHARSVAADRILTGKYTAIPVFVAIMALVFWLTFDVVGQRLSDLLALGIDWVTARVDAALSAFGLNPVVHSLVIDGVFAGVGSVLSFLPIIVVLFILLSILEDSGYMARVAFVMDKLLRRLGLSGRSFVPMLIGFGCSVPAIMATRTLPSEHDRKMTVMLTPFMSCSAKVPVYALFSAAFFPECAPLVMIALYLMGIVVGILVALVLKGTAFRGDPVPFVMELPNYRMPAPRTVARLAWDKAKGFATKAFTIIFVASVVIWFLQTFDVRLNVVSDQSQSMLAALGALLAPLFAPLGFGNWLAAAALAAGFGAKENVVATLTVLMGGSTAGLPELFSPLTAFAFLTFTLLYTPCVAAVSAVKAELGTRMMWAVVAMQCGVAWVVALVVRLVGMVLGLG